MINKLIEDYVKKSWFGECLYVVMDTGTEEGWRIMGVRLCVEYNKQAMAIVILMDLFHFVSSLFSSICDGHLCVFLHMLCYKTRSFIHLTIKNLLLCIWFKQPFFCPPFVLGTKWGLSNHSSPVMLCFIVEVFVMIRRRAKIKGGGMKKMKYVLVTGGVVSGLGKGVTASSIGLLLKNCGLRVTSIKIGLYSAPLLSFIYSTIFIFFQIVYIGINCFTSC